MPVTIENLTNRPVLLRLNSGETLHLAPRLTSGALADVEVEANAKVEKLLGQQVIAIHPVKEKAPVNQPIQGNPDKNVEEATAATKRKKGGF